MPQDWKDILMGRYADELAALPEEAPAEIPVQPQRKQRLVVSIDRLRRAGKQVTLVSGFDGDEASLAALGTLLRKRLGVGGSAADGEILLQGDVRDKVVSLLKEMGHAAKRGN